MREFRNHTWWMLLTPWLVLASWLVAAASSIAQTEGTEDSRVIRELYVPYGDLEVLLNKETERIYLTRDEFESLKQAAKSDPQADTPLDVVLLDADYEAELRKGRAWVTGSLTLEVLSAGLQVLPLRFTAGALRSASLDGQPASLARDDAGTTQLLVEGIGLHKLSVQLILPVSMDSAQQSLQLQLPVAAAGSLRLEVPGNVEIKSGATVADRSVDEQAGLTRFQLVPSDQPMAIVMSLNNRQLRERSTLMVRGVLISEITSGYERLHATMSMDISNGATNEFRFLVDESLDVSDVACDGLASWGIQPNVSGEGQPSLQELVVKLRQPATEMTVVNMRLDRKQFRPGSWQRPTLTPLDVQGFSAVIGLAVEDRLQASEITAQELLPIDSRVLGATLAPCCWPPVKVNRASP